MASTEFVRKEHRNPQNQEGHNHFEGLSNEEVLAIKARDRDVRKKQSYPKVTSTIGQNKSAPFKGPAHRPEDVSMDDWRNYMTTGKVPNGTTDSDWL